MTKPDSTSSTSFDYEGEMEFFGEAVEEVTAHDWIEHDMSLWVMPYPEVLKDKLILDIGAGEGGYGVTVCERHEPRRFVPLELVPQRLIGAARRAKDLPALAPVAGSAYELPHPDNSFDIAIGNGALHHMPDTGAVAKEVARVLKPRGIYFGREPNFHNVAVYWYVLHGPHVSPNEFACWPKNIRKAFEENGFDVEIAFFWRRAPWVKGRYFAVSQRVKAVWRGDDGE